MGNNNSSGGSLSAGEKINAVATSPNYLTVKKRATKLGIQMTFQDDGSIQLQNPKDLVNGHRIVPGPSTPDKAEATLQKVLIILEQLMPESGYMYIDH